MKRLFLTYIILFSCGINNISNGQAYQHAVFEKVNTLNNASFFKQIYDIETDDKGYVYLATDNGVYLYNGSKIDIYNNNLTGSNNEFIKFFKPNDSILFAFPFEGTLTKLGLLGSKKISKLKIKNNEIYTVHNVFQFDSSYYFLGKIFSKSAMLLKLDQLNSNDLKLTNYEKEIYFDDYKNYLNSLVSKINIDHENIFQRIDSSTDNQIEIFNNNFFTVKDNVYLIKHGNISSYFSLSKHGLSGNILDFKPISNSQFLICVDGKSKGLYLYDGINLRTLYYEDIVTGVVEDVYHNIIFSTLNNGLYKINKVNKNYIVITFPNVKIKTLLSDNNSNEIYLNDINGNLYIYDIAQKLLHTRIDQKGSYKKSSLIQVKDGIAFSDEFHTLIIKNNISQNIPYSNKYVFSFLSLLYHEYNNNFVSINKYDISHYEYSNNKYYATNTYSKINFAKVLNDSMIHLFSKKGLYEYQILKHEYKKIITHTEIDFYGGEEIISLQNKNYYLANNKLYIVDRSNKFKLYLNLNIKNHIFKIIPYKNYFICITSSGYSLINNTGKVLLNINLVDKSFLNEIKGALVKDNNLILYNSLEIYQIPINKIDTTIHKPNIYFSNLIYSADTLNLFSNHNLSFLFKNNSKTKMIFHTFNLDFENELLQYSLYKDKNPIIENIDLSSNEVTFSNLMPGKYEFKISHKNILIANLYFTILPLWHQLLITKIILTIILSLMIIYFLFILFNNLNRKKTINENKQIKLFQLESFAKLNQLKSHFIFNALTPIQNYILNNKNDLALNYLHNFSDLLRDIMNMSSVEMISINDEIKFLTNFLKIQKEEKSSTFNFSIENKNSTDESNNIHVPTLLIQPIVENAINYGITSIAPQQGQIKIIFNNPTEDNYLEVKVIDNGTGSNELFKIKDTKNAHALQIIKERLYIFAPNKHKELISSKITKNGFEITIYLPIKL